MTKKRVLFLGTGGTITAKKVQGVWKPGEFSEEDLLHIVPELSTLAEITALNLFNIDSVCMQPAYWVQIAETIESYYSEYVAFVISHGTDTMHYTAAALSFLMQHLTKPVVITGSMVPPHQIGSDAKINLIDAFRVATDSNIHEVLLVFNHKIIRGNRAKKFRELEYDAFRSIGMKPIGIIEETIRYTGEPYRTAQPGDVPQFYHRMEEHIGIQKITPGYDPEILVSLVRMGYRGIITEGYGSGNLPTEENSLLEVLKSITEGGIPIIVCSQCAVGVSWMYLYDAGMRALRAGAIPGYDMTSETSLVKLMWLLGEFPDVSKDKLRNMVLKDFAGEISSITSAKLKRVWE